MEVLFVLGLEVQALVETVMGQVTRVTVEPILDQVVARLPLTVEETVPPASSSSAKVSAFFRLSFCMSTRISEGKTGKYWSLGPQPKSGTIRILKSKGPMMG
jgi:hypothetical protein